MKLLIAVLLIIQFSCQSTFPNKLNEGKKVPTDTLSKYSYDLFTYLATNNGVLPTAGTGFFIRANNKIFLITANHVLCGCDDNLKKMSPYPNLWNILNLDVTDNGKLISLNTKYFRDTCTCLAISKKSDIAIHEMDSKYYNYPLNSIEEFISPRYHEYDSFAVFGFPGTGYSRHPSGFGYMPPEKITFTAYDSTSLMDDFNYYFNIPNIDSIKRGHSGSPVFIRNKKNKKWRICGVVVAETIDSATKKRYLAVATIDKLADTINKKNN